MIISLNWLKQYVDIDLPVQELVELIGERLVEVEGVEYIGDKYKDARIVHVVSCKSLENSDHLNVAIIDDGCAVEGVERNEHGHVQVVCGAPNVREGIDVVWLPPRSIVPDSYNKKPFVLEAKELRGVMSNGMLASARELDLYDYHEGIVVVDKAAEPGARFMDVYDLDDYLLDIENKSLTHRPDAFGLIGFAREVAGIQGRPFQNPHWFSELEVSSAIEGDEPAPRISIEDNDLSARFSAVVLTDIDENKLSPLYIQSLLARSGIRPISASVDISNYMMLISGQPSHTYDYDKLLDIAGDDPVVKVRLAREYETLKLLDGREVTLDVSDIVIAAGDTAVGLAGAMGGAGTTVDASTKRVLLEVATFDLYRLRATQMRHGIFSEAITRFTKGIPAAVAVPVTQEAIRLFGEYTGGRTLSAIGDVYPEAKAAQTVSISMDMINRTLGTQFAAEDVMNFLENVGFTIAFDDTTATVTVPYWREDIHIPEDVIEEVGRLAGFDTINMTLPLREAAAVQPDAFAKLQTRIRRYLAQAGANEALTYSFVHGDVLSRAGQKVKDSYKIINSISPELQYYRQSLTPSLLGLIHPNSKMGYESFALFELNKTHDVPSGVNEENVPLEHDRLSLVVTGATGVDQPAFYGAKRYLEYLANKLGKSFEYQVITGDEADVATSPYEPKHSAVVFDKETGAYVGIVGEYKKAVSKAWKLSEVVAGFEVNTRALLSGPVDRSGAYEALSRYPATARDICFQVPSSTTYDAVVQEVRLALESSDVSTSVEPVDIYKENGADVKNVTIRINMVSYEKTLSQDEIAAVGQAVGVHVSTALGGKVV